MTNNEPVSRPKRTPKPGKEENIDILSNIKKARESGTKYIQEYKEPDIYVFVDDKEYAEIQEKRQKDCIVDDNGEYVDDGKEVFDDSDEEVEAVGKKRKKTNRNPNIKRSKSILQGKSLNIPDMFMKAPPAKTAMAPTNVNFDDLLDECKRSYSVSTTPKIKATKVAAKSSKKTVSNVFANSINKPKFKLDTPKAVRGSDEVLPAKKKPQKKSLKEVIGSYEFDDIVKELVQPVSTPDASKTKATKLPMKKTPSLKEIVNIRKEMSATEIDDFPDDSMDSWMDEAPTTVVKDKEIDEFDGVDFDEPMETHKGYCDEKTNVNVKTATWDQCEQQSPITDTFDMEMFEDIEDGTKTQVYWLDAYHDPKIPGAVFLFGKTFDAGTKAIVNCCIKITGLERRMYFLPKPEFELNDVHKELGTIFDRLKVAQFRCKSVMKKYAFQLAEVPDEAEYMMVQYDSKNAALPADIVGETFSQVFGCDTSILELLILDLKLKGPCWLNFTNLTPTSKKFSVCKLDFEVHGIKGVSKCNDKLPVPKLTLLSLNIKSVTNSKSNINEIVSVGCFVDREVSFDQQPRRSSVYQSSFTILTAPKDSAMPYDLNKKLSTDWKSRYKDTVSIAPNERALLNNLLAQIQKLDPDVVVGHSLFGHQLQLILQRCQSLNINTWHRLGRLTRNIQLPRITGRSTNWMERMATAGRLVCDTEFSGRELVKCRSYELPEMVKDILHGTISTIGDLSQSFRTSSSVQELINLTNDEAIVNIHLMHQLQILPLAYQITAICGNLIVRTLSTGKSERNEYLLLHAFNEKNYLVPDKFARNKEVKHDVHEENGGHEEGEASGKRKATYLGGLVLEPKKGFYENFILLMDFNSLYPSIIQELNICFTTIDRREYLNGPDASDPDSLDTPLSKVNRMNELTLNSSTKPPGILPIEIRKLVESRKQIKGLLATPKADKESQEQYEQKRAQYDIRQKALKITANSMYGCLGFSLSRFYAPQLAAMITCKGREMLQKTKETVESGNIVYKVNNVPTKLNLEIVYGDTDSIMVNTGLNKLSDYDTVMAYGKRIKDEINKAYKHIQIDIDGVFRRLLLLKKKKYAALTISKNPKTGELETKQELKGLDIVRRDWCKLASEVGRNVVKKILEGEMLQEDLVLDISEYLVSIKEKVNNGSLPLDQFVITKGLARNPETYDNAKSQPHVQVALRHNKSGASRLFKAQDTVEYIICDDGSTLNAIQRAYSPAEVRGNSSSMKIDSNYYLSHQLHPVISRLVDGIEGLSPASVAESLGLDPKSYVKYNVAEETERGEDDVMVGMDKFKNCRPLSLRCVKCQTVNELSSAIPATGRGYWPCSTCKSEIVTAESFNLLLNTLTKTILQYKKNYYKSVFVCQELLCGYKCAEVPVVGHVDNSKCVTGSGQWICPHCGQGTMRPVFSHTDLFNQILFFKSLFTDKRKDESMDQVRRHISSYLKNSAYGIVSFSKLGALCKPKVH